MPNDRVERLERPIILAVINALCEGEIEAFWKTIPSYVTGSLFSNKQIGVTFDTLKNAANLGDGKLAFTRLLQSLDFSFEEMQSWNVSNVCEALDISVLIEELVDGYKLKRLAECLNKNIKFNYETAKFALEQEMEELSKLKAIKPDINTLEAHLGNLCEDLANGVSVESYKTGIDELDNRLGGGITKGSYNVVVGRPSMGKSSFGTCLGMNMLTLNDNFNNALFLSLEMSSSDTRNKLLSLVSDVAAWKIKKMNKLSEIDISRITSLASNKKIMENITILDSLAIGDTTLQGLRNTVENHQKKGKLDLIVIDQASFISFKEPRLTVVEKAAMTSAFCKKLSQDLGVTVFLLVQANRESTKTNSGRATMDTIAGGDNFSQDAESVFIVHREAKQNNDGTPDIYTDIMIEKSRWGEIGCVEAGWNGQLGKITNLTCEQWSDKRKAKEDKKTFKKKKE